MRCSFILLLINNRSIVNSNVVYRRIQEVFLVAGDDGNGGGVDVQCRRADEEISRVPGQRQNERRS